ncbi:bifunctional 2-polyprenyl-6-hydroxyphenol methylase/3-demethylubiquinol 3-O-methyltransferase UbiG [Massilia sp. TS11]|uniref:class I SAM-dependent methyltransferase n=1 Tax=Massilia sp. TS11 TaxID=2908003 RepID=UPI001EDA5099|nr:methyltransferase domain-containing protein [Massilia sp. TS11]MCG2582964.1 class I SAM-dependent methyltransferase [Massilia sp. TS11]
MRQPVSPWVRRFAALVPGGEVLDLACGAGRHARHFAGLGYPVLAVDRDSAALASLVGVPGISCMEYDLEDGRAFPFGPGRFAGIVVTHYLHRPLLDALVASLAPDGVLIYETFAQGNEAFGKPSNPAFLLAPGELLALAARHRLQVLAYEDGLTAQPAALQRLCALGPAFPREHGKLETF